MAGNEMDFGDITKPQRSMWDHDQSDWFLSCYQRGQAVHVGEDLPVNAEAYYDAATGSLRLAHGKLTRDTPIFRVGQTLKAGESADRHWTNGLVVRADIQAREER